MAHFGDFPVTLKVRVAWGEMDAYQHVNNTVYFRYFENGRIAYFEAMGILKTEVGPILRSASCRFRIPVTYPDEVRVGARVASVEAGRFLMEYAVFSEQHQKVAATGEGEIVAFNYPEKRKVLVPPSWREAIARIEAGRGS